MLPFAQGMVQSSSEYGCRDRSGPAPNAALEVLYYPEEQAIVDRLRAIVVDR